MERAINAWKRYYQSNFDFEENKGNEDIDCIAYVVQEFLYTDKASFENFNCKMTRRIKLFDFMTLVRYFMTPLFSDFYKSILSEYVVNLQQKRSMSEQYDTIEYINNNDGMVVYNASSELILSLLWTVYIIAYTHYLTEKTKSWEDKTDAIYKMIRENSPYVESFIKEQSPLKYTQEAIKMLSERVHNKREQEKQEPEMSETKLDDTDKLKARIAELEEKCKQQTEKLKEYEEPVELLAPHDKVRLDILLGLMENNGANLNKHGNKTKAAQLMNAITDLPLQTCKNYCSDRNVNTKLHEEEVLKINTLLQALDMKIRL